MNPYEVLGVSPYASDEEVRNAYKELVKKYHPDKYVNDPMADYAAEKIKEINVAYDTIVNERKQGQQGGNSSYGNSYGNSSYSSSPFSEIYDALRVGNLNLAEGKLQNVPVAQRTAEWFYLYGEVYRMRGYTDQARQYYQTACNMEPDNPAFQQALQGMYANYNTYTGNRPNNTEFNTNTLCTVCETLYCADCCCECMGGDLIRCC